ncbi:MAG: hypothetical protein PHC92_04840 [Syntrophomonadaceae bacterium]|nr:hypothetical protein [Syntrophomonadaceae bacterium]
MANLAFVFGNFYILDGFSGKRGFNYIIGFCCMNLEFLSAAPWQLGVNLDYHNLSNIKCLAMGKSCITGTIHISLLIRNSNGMGSILANIKASVKAK